MTTHDTTPQVMTMPRSLQEILDSADELARRFEETDPDSLEWRDAAPLRRIHAAVQARAAAEREVTAAVSEAREAGLPWAAIGGYVGTSGEAARQRYGTPEAGAPVKHRKAKAAKKAPARKRAASGKATTTKTGGKIPAPVDRRIS